MTPYSNIFVAILLIFLLSINITFFARDIRQPSNIYLVVWIIMFTLLSLPLVSYTRISNPTYFLVVISAIIFMIFSVLGGRVNKDRLPRGEHFEARFIPNNALVIIGSIGLSTALLYYQARFGLELLITNPNLVREQDTGGTGLLGLLIFLPSVTFIIIATQASMRRKLEVSTLCFLIAVFLYMAILPERATLIVTLVWSGLSIYATDVRLQRPNWSFLRRYGIRIIVSLAIFLSFFLIVSARTQKSVYLDNIEYALNLDSGIPKALFDPYIYITANIPALSVYMSDIPAGDYYIKFNPNRTAVFLKRLAQVVFKTNIAGENINGNAKFTHVPFLFNTYSWLQEPLEDYGLFGALIFITLYAFLSGLAWSYRCVFFSPLSCFIYGWGASAAVFSILANKFSGIYPSYSLIIVFALYGAASIVWNKRIKVSIS